MSLPDGRTLPARVAAQDPEIDMALVQIEADPADPAELSAELSLHPALIADARSLKVGQLVWAVGHPWGERNYVSGGIISGMGKARTDGPRGEVDVLHSDARLAPGNSGGPLVNMAGAVVGINTMIVGGDRGVALASHVASAFAEQAIKELPYNVTYGTPFGRKKNVKV